ncbi:MAG: hypothetical protein ABIG64_02485 [Candidatus Omnitrophota bacterium]
MKQGCWFFYIRCMFSFFIILFTFTSFSYASEGGARPTSMGGAYVAISDDVHAASWNPAGLGWQRDREISYSGIINCRDDYITGDFISDDYLAYAQPIEFGVSNDVNPYGGIGFYFHNNNYSSSTVKTSLWQPGIAYGRRFSSYENMGWGIALNYYMFDSQIPGQTTADEAISFNLGYLWYLNNQLTLGLLCENVNEPTYTVHGITNRLIRVMRPGMAYYFSDNTLMSFDIYDLTGNTSGRGGDYSQNLRLGFEHYFTDEISVRLGVHHPNSKVDASKFYSLGLGLMHADFLSLYPVTYYIDYTFIYWQDPVAGFEDYTHQLGLIIRF